MSFETHIDWEINDPFFKTISEDEGVMVYHTFKSILHDLIFICDVTFIPKDSGFEYTDTYYFDDINHALTMVTQEFILKSKISLLSQRHDNNDNNYAVSDVIEISKGKDNEGDVSYVYSCQNGMTYIDSLHAKTTKEISQLKVIYYQK